MSWFSNAVSNLAPAAIIQDFKSDPKTAVANMLNPVHNVATAAATPAGGSNASASAPSSTDLAASAQASSAADAAIAAANSGGGPIPAPVFTAPASVVNANTVKAGTVKAINTAQISVSNSGNLIIVYIAVAVAILGISYYFMFSNK